MEIKSVYENEKLYYIDFSGVILERVTFRNCIITDADFRGANLREVRFYNSKLTSVNFDEATLFFCSFPNCNLHDISFVDAVIDHTNFGTINYISKVDFSKSKIKSTNFKFISCPQYAIFNDASLVSVNFSFSNLCSASFIGAILTDVDFSIANLPNLLFNRAQFIDVSFYSANLFSSDFSEAKLSSCNFRYANLAEVKLPSSILLDCNCIFTGSNLYNCDMNNMYSNLLEYKGGKILTENIIGYKKCKPYNRIYYSFNKCTAAIVTLEIPRGAIVFSVNGKKCRTNRAKVLDIVDSDGNKVPRARSYRGNLTYYVGDEFNIYDFDCEYNKECSKGIHFFMTREEAENYK